MGDDKEIKSKEIVVGYKKKFVFHRGNPQSGDKTNWIMKEYRITHPPIERNPRIKNGKRVSRFILLFFYNIIWISVFFPPQTSLLSSVVDLIIIDFLFFQIDKWILCKLYKRKEGTSRKNRTQKACSKSHANEMIELSPWQMLIRKQRKSILSKTSVRSFQMTRSQ